VRVIVVGSGPMEMAPVTLRAAGGHLLLSSDPPGASVSLNGQPTDRVTPADIVLAPGIYTVTIEKNGRQSTDKVEIKDSGTTYRKILLGQ
jgi:hypothetical protein